MFGLFRADPCKKIEKQLKQKLSMFKETQDNLNKLPFITTTSHKKLRQRENLQGKDFGGFGDQHTERDLVAQQALRATHQRWGQSVMGEQIFVIGDTPADSKMSSVKNVVLRVAPHALVRGCVRKGFAEFWKFEFVSECPPDLDIPMDTLCTCRVFCRI